MNVKQVMCLVGPLIAVFSATSVLAGDEVKFGKISPEEWQVVAPSDYPEADAVVLFSKAHLEIKDEYIIMQCHVRIKVLTQAGAERVGNQSFGWHKEYDKIKDFSAQTITPDGRKIEVDKSAVFDKQSGDYLEKSFTFPAVQPGCILEYRYKVINERFWYLNPWYFQTDIYTFKSTFAVSVPNGFVYNVLYQNVPPAYREAHVEERPDMDGDLSLGETIKTFTWEQTNLPPITDEPYMSSEYDYRSCLRFQIVSYDYRGFKYSYSEGWDKKAEYLEDIFSDYRNAGGAVRKLAQQATANLVDEQEKSRAIYDFVNAEYRTVNDYKYHYFGHEYMSEFLQTKSGTGEEKNFLMVLMNQEAGISAWPIMISTRDNAKFDPAYPDLRQFNYLIALVQFKNDYEYVDCSSRQIPFGLLPPNCLVDGGLLLDGKQSELVKVKQSAIYSGRTDQTDMYIGSDGTVNCSSKCSFRGYYASNYGERYELTTPEEFVKEEFLERLNSAYQLGKYECRLDSTDTFVATAEYTVEDVVDRLDENLVVKPIGFAFRSNPFESAKRFFPVDFNYPFTYKNVVEVHVGDSVRQYVLPGDTVLTIPGASFKRECRRTDSSAIVVTTMVIEKPEFLPAVYSQLRDFFAQVARVSEDELTAQVAISGN